MLKRGTSAYAHRLIALLVASSGLAGASLDGQALRTFPRISMRVPVEDALVNASSPDTTDNGTSLGVQGTASPGGECAQSIVSYLKFSLTGMQSLHAASLILRSTFASSSGDLGMGLFGVSADAWHEDTVTYSNYHPTLGASLSTASLTPEGADVTFASTPALVSFLENQRTGDGVVTLALAAVSCNAFSVTQVMSSREGSASPQLIVDDSAVTSTASATSSSTPTATLTSTATQTLTDSPTATNTPTSSPTATPTMTPTATNIQSFTWHLQAGWNLVGNPGNRDLPLDEIKGQLRGGLGSIYTFDCTEGHWHGSGAGTPYDIQSLAAGAGAWIQVSVAATATFTVTATSPQSSCAGWSLVASPVDSNPTTWQALGMRRVCDYTSSRWHCWEAESPAYASTLASSALGAGLWVYY